MTTNTQPQTQQSGGDELLDSVGKWIAGLACPACGRKNQLFIGYGGFVTCSADDCPNPDYADALEKAQQGREQEARIDELRLLAEEVKLFKPRNKFVYNKYLRIAYFNERMAQLQPQAGEGGEV